MSGLGIDARTKETCHSAPDVAKKFLVNSVSDSVAKVQLVNKLVLPSVVLTANPVLPNPPVLVRVSISKAFVGTGELGLGFTISVGQDPVSSTE